MKGTRTMMSPVSDETSDETRGGPRGAFAGGEAGGDSPGAPFPAPVLPLTDGDILCAMSASLCCSAAWRARTAAKAGAWVESVTPGDLDWARRVREQAELFQGADVDRLLAAPLADGAGARLRADWGEVVPEEDPERVNCEPARW